MQLTCPLTNECTWKGTYQTVLKHLTQIHSLSTLDDVKTCVDLNKLHSSKYFYSWNHIRSLYGEHFLVVRKLDIEKNSTSLFHYLFRIRVELIGAREKAKNFYCKMKINNKENACLTWEASVGYLEADKSKFEYNFGWDSKMAKLFMGNDSTESLLSILKKN
jgi:hypothetical protein